MEFPHSLQSGLIMRSVSYKSQLQTRSPVMTKIESYAFRMDMAERMYTWMTGKKYRDLISRISYCGFVCGAKSDKCMELTHHKENVGLIGERP